MHFEITVILITVLCLYMKVFDFRKFTLKSWVKSMVCNLTQIVKKKII